MKYCTRTEKDNDTNTTERRNETETTWYLINLANEILSTPKSDT